MIDRARCLLASLIVLGAMLPLPGLATISPATDGAPQIAASVPQGGLVRGTLVPGSRLWLVASSAHDPASAAAQPVEIKVGADGRFVLGVARDETGPIQLRLVSPDQAESLVAITVVARQWRLEVVDGVPEATVNPPPGIAARIEKEQAEVSAARERDDDRDDYQAEFSWPLTGRVSGVYGSQRIYNGTPKSPHSGLDVAAAKGTPVRAPAGGVISFAKPDLYLTGGTVLVDHGHGLSSSFLHLSRIDVAVGQRVEQGQVIGLVGATGRATGPHMHWGMNWFAVRVDPQLLVDPARNPAATSATARP